MYTFINEPVKFGVMYILHNDIVISKSPTAAYSIGAKIEVYYYTNNDARYDVTEYETLGELIAANPEFLGDNKLCIAI